MKLPRLFGEAPHIPPAVAEPRSFGSSEALAAGEKELETATIPQAKPPAPDFKLGFRQDINAPEWKGYMSHGESGNSTLDFFYDESGLPKYASHTLKNQEGNYTAHEYAPHEIEFPPYKDSHLTNLKNFVKQAQEGEKPSDFPDIQVGPWKVSDLSHFQTEIGEDGKIISEYDTPEGGTIAFHYDKNGDPVEAIHYDDARSLSNPKKYTPQEAEFPQLPEHAKPSPWIKEQDYFPENEDITAHAGSELDENGHHIDDLLEQKPFYPNFNAEYPFAGGAKLINSGKFHVDYKLRDGSEVTIYHDKDGNVLSAGMESPAGDLKTIHKSKIPFKQVQSGVKPMLDPTIGGDVKPVEEGPSYKIYIDPKNGDKWTFYYEEGKPASAFQSTFEGKTEHYMPKEVVFPPFYKESAHTEEGPVDTSPVDEPQPPPEDIQRRLKELSREEEHAEFIGYTPRLHESLVPNEREAVLDYSSVGYQAINGSLIGKREVDHKTSQQITALDNLFSKVRLPYDVTLYRYIGPNAWSKLRAVPVGGTYLHKPFASSSFKKLSGFSREDGGLMVILAEKGTPGFVLGSVSSNVGEQEVLLRRGLGFKVLGKEGRRVYVQVIPDKTQPLAPHPISHMREYIESELPWEYREYTEYAQHAVPGAFKDFVDFKAKLDAAPLVHLSEPALKNMEYSTAGSYINAGKDKLYAGLSYHRDLGRIEKQLFEEKMPPPIVLETDNGLRILGGNTRLATGAAYGIMVPVKLIDVRTK